MSLLVLMYHRASAGRHGNSPDMLEAHLAHIAHTYPTVMPGDPIAPGAINVCLSFDDGYFDFYSTVFPLLERYGLQALLAVPPRVILDHVEARAGDRMKIESAEAFANPNEGGFCTWNELAEMVLSGHVTIAAHGFNHTRLDGADANLGLEIEAPQRYIRRRLAQPITSFVFPFGRFSVAALHYAKRQYQHVFRIGGALNRDWNGRVLYRVDADGMETPWSLFAPGRILQYRARYFWNQLRAR